MILFKNALVHSPPQESSRADILIEGERIAKFGKMESTLDADVHGDKVILPAYIDSHIHLLEYGYSLTFTDLRNARSKDEVMEMLVSHLPQAEMLGFLYALNLAPERLKEKDWEPFTSDLDRVSSDLPVFIRREDGHTSYLNTRARHWLLYDQPISGADTPLSGRFNELAVERMQERIPAAVRADALLTGAAELLNKGITCAGVMIGDEKSLRDAEIMNSLGERLGIRAELFPQNRNVEKILSLGLERLGGCILVDGSFGSRTAALREPYTDAPGNKGILYFTQKELDSLVEKGAEADLQMTFHAIGDEAVEQVISAFSKVAEKGNPSRHRIEHAELMPPDLIERAAELDLILSVQPEFARLWGGEAGMYADRLGERVRWTDPFRSFLDAGIRIAAGSDAPITHPSPAQGMSAFLNHPTFSERISPSQAVSAYTSSAAYALNLEDRLGSVSEGFQADLLVFSSDPFQTLNFQPRAVIRKGRVVSGSI